MPEIARVVLSPDAAVRPLHVLGDAEVLDRRRVRVPAGGRASFATLLSAFPAAHWARWTAVEQVRLRVRVTGPGRVTVHRSDAAGAAREVGVLDGEEHVLPLAGSPDGGWCWFDVEALRGDVVVEEAAWLVDGGPEPASALTVVMTTVDRPAEVLAVLRALAGDPRVLEALAAVVVVDQGRVHLRDRPGLAEAEAALGGRLQLREQPNLGGSGGTARGMLAALDRGEGRHVLVLDDDVAVEPESVLRALAFADRCRQPTLVGGQMLDLRRPTVLHTPGERVDPRRFLWETVPPGREDHDVAAGPLHATPWLHRRLDVGFNAWWTCLVPLAVLREVGLPMPFFLKWDDVELGVRAGRAGFPTVTLPGVAVWHEPWTGKPDALGWQAYFHHRNRLVAGLLHSLHPWGGSLLPESLQHTWRALRHGRHGVAALRLAAMQDVVAGPAALHPSLATALPRVLALQRAADAAGRRGLPRLLAGTARQHLRLAAAWPRLRRGYRAALPALTSPAAWRRTLGLPPGR